jgi:hypothetical protein
MSNLLEKRRRRNFGDRATEAEDQTRSHELKGRLASRHEDNADECDPASKPNGWTSTKAIADPVTNKSGDRRREEQGRRDETKPVASGVAKVATCDYCQNVPNLYVCVATYSCQAGTA